MKLLPWLGFVLLALTLVIVLQSDVENRKAAVPKASSLPPPPPPLPPSPKANFRVGFTGWEFAIANNGDAPAKNILLTLNPGWLGGGGYTLVINRLNQNKIRVAKMYEFQSRHGSRFTLASGEPETMHVRWLDEAGEEHSQTVTVEAMQ